jgi:hypothetical protein
MFDRIKKALLGPAPAAAPQPAAASPAAAVEGVAGGKAWKVEIGKPTRSYIHGEELRGRAELGLDEDIAVLVMNRPLKETLERKAYSMITDTLETKADPNLPEEMRWLAMFQEVGWDSLPRSFWAKYAVLAEHRQHAQAFLDAPLARLLLDWPPPAPANDVPFLLLILRGKAYLRMQYTPADPATLEHAVRVFSTACESAIGGLTGHVDL